MRAMRRRMISGMCLLFGVALAGYSKFIWIRAHAPAPGSIARLGAALPPLPVEDVAGRPMDIREAAVGSRSIIIFYSASCRSCRAMLPLLQPIPVTLRVFLVNEGTGNSSWIKEMQGFDKALLCRDPNRVLSRSFRMSALPTILLVDESGILRGASVGERSRDLMQRKVRAFAEKQP